MCIRDSTLCVLAQALIAALRARLLGYATVTPDVLQRRFLETRPVECSRFY